jgi:membrane protein YqaA with SNARE-associated domain
MRGVLQYYEVKKVTTRSAWLKKWLIPLLVLLLFLAVSVALFFFGRDPELISRLEGYGYFGVFLLSLIGNASILLPGIVLSLLTGLGIIFYSVGGLWAVVMVGLAGGAGAAIGELVGYIVGYTGRGVVEKSKLYWRLVGWVKRWGALAIFFFAVFPFFFDLVSLAAGVLRFPLWKFMLFCWLGRTILYVGFLALAALGVHLVLPYFG